VDGRGDVLVAQTRYSAEEIARRGRELYEKQIRHQVETEENIGKIVSIDVETGDHEVVDDVGITSSQRLRARHPGAQIWAERIGFDAAYALGGTLTRTTPE
jgi:hypothetical protein